MRSIALTSLAFALLSAYLGYGISAWSPNESFMNKYPSLFAVLGFVLTFSVCGAASFGWLMKLRDVGVRWWWAPLLVPLAVVVWVWGYATLNGPKNPT